MNYVFLAIKKAGDFIITKSPAHVLGVGLEPTQPQWPRDFKSLVSTDSTIRAAFLRESGKRDSDSRPQPWQGCALPTELFPQNYFIIFRHSRLHSAKLKRAWLCAHLHENSAFVVFAILFCGDKDKAFISNHQTFLEIFLLTHLHVIT